MGLPAAVLLLFCLQLTVVPGSNHERQHQKHPTVTVHLGPGSSTTTSSNDAPSPPIDAEWISDQRTDIFPATYSETASHARGDPAGAHSTHSHYPKRKPGTSFCGITPHHNWHYRHGKFYTLFPKATCRFPDCQRACQENNATMAFPSSVDELASLRTFANFYTGNTFLGLHLPMYQETNSSCRGSDCDNYLVYANGSQFRHADWLHVEFDRRPFQERCFELKVLDSPPTSVVSPIPCTEPRTVICEAVCPRPGPPISPPPLDVQRKERYDISMMRLSLPPTFSSDENSENELLDGHGDDARVTHHTYTPDLQHLPAFPTDPNFGAPPDVASDYDLIGYDCSMPRDKTPVQMERVHNPCGTIAPPMSQRNATFALLQKADKLPITVRQCRITQTTIPYYCGVWSHTAINPKWINIEERITIAPDKCDQLWTTLKYTDPKKGVHDLAVNASTRVSYLIAGAITQKTSGPSCTGGDYHFKGETHKHMVVTVSRQFHLYTYEANVDEDEIIDIPTLDLVLPCAMSKHQCQTQNFGTFTWNPLPRPQNINRQEYDTSFN